MARSTTTPLSYSGHYYEGAVYLGNATSTMISMNLTVPLDPASSSDFYYVLMSTWDDAGSYDQFGFANSYGIWGVTYSTTTYCGGTYFYNPDAWPLSEGATYDFQMSIGNSTVMFNLINSTGKSEWNYQAYVPTTQFNLSEYYTCAGGTFYDYTDYEEVYQTGTDYVPYDFFFDDNLNGTTPVTNWAEFNSVPPLGITTVMSSANVVIANEPYSLALQSGNGTVMVPYRAFDQSALVPLKALNVDSSPSVTLSATPPPGWTVTEKPSSGTPTFGFTVNVTVPASSSPGTYSISIAASDLPDRSNNLTLTVEIPAPLAGTVLIRPGSIVDVGAMVNYSLTVTGGFGKVAVEWSGLPVGCEPRGFSFNCTANQTGRYLVIANLSDQSGENVSVSAPLQIVPAPSILLSATPRVTWAEHTVSFSADASGGVGSYTFLWMGLPPGCFSVTSTASCWISDPGNLSVKVTVTDSTGYHATSPSLLVVVYAPGVVTLDISAPLADVGQSVDITATATGGSGNFTYAFSGLPGNCTVSGRDATCVPNRNGTFVVGATATDSAQFQTPIATSVIEVYTMLKVTAHLARSGVDVGQIMQITAAASGGRPPYTVGYAGLPIGCRSSNAWTLNCRPSNTSISSGVVAYVTDANGFQAFSSPANFTVYALPTIVIVSSPSHPTVGSSLTLTAEVSGGAGTFLYVWNGMPPGCDVPPQAVMMCTPSGSGSFNISVNATDLLGGSGNGSLVISVAPSSATTIGLLLLVVGIAAILAVVGIVIVIRRRRRTPPSEPETPAP